MIFTEKLDKLMEEKGINRAELARHSGVPYTTIVGFYEKGYENTKLSTLQKLVNYFGCSLDYLADDNVIIDKKSATITDDGLSLLDIELTKMMRNLTPHEADQVLAFVKGLKSRKA